MKVDEIVLGSVNVGQYAFVSIQDNWVLQWVQLGLAIACSIVLLAYRIWRWYKEAKKDGKVDKEEIKDLVNIIGDGVDEIKGHLDNKEDKK